MLRIHHATAKRAADAGVELTIEGDLAKATKGESSVYTSEPKYAVEWALLAETLRAEYPALTVALVEDSQLPGVFHSATSTFLEFEDSDKAPSIADIQEACEAAGIDPEAEQPEDEAEGAKGNVVPLKYKELYRSRGNPDHCGDWLAGWLDGRFTDAEGRFNADAYLDCLRENDVPLDGKWTQLPVSGGKGWQGRFRMNGRQILEKYVAKAGTVVHLGASHEVPADALSELRTKHAKWLTKEAVKAASTETPAEQPATEA